MYHTINGTCGRSAAIIAVDKSGRYGNQAKASTQFPILIDLNSCGYQMEAISGQQKRVKGRFAH